MIEHEAAQRLYDKLGQARANNGGQLSKVEWLRITAENFKAEIDAAKRAGRAPRVKGERDVLFDTLAVCCGYNLQELSKDAGRIIGVAMASIRSVMDELTPEEIKKRTARYQLKYRLNPTPKAIADKWATLGDPDGERKRPGMDVYVEPKEWLQAAQRIWGLEVGGNIHAKGWFNIDTNYRGQILADIINHEAQSERTE